MAEAVALEFESPAGEALRFEWTPEAFAAIDPAGPAPEPVWTLAGELDWDEIDAVRVVSARLDDGRLLAIAALRPAGAAGHGEELVAGAIGDGESFAQLEQALLSTEHGPDGRPRRVGLELYSAEDGLALRIAGDVTSVSGFSNGGVERLGAALELRGAGSTGAGAYDTLARA
ncbi:MAG: hypothetical protein QOI10_2454 [Solirubrobacterales bacterium]|jgi:hypothetical protein|nr:hypothetical protein [Solirubrobacterales bacterium]